MTGDTATFKCSTNETTSVYWLYTAVGSMSDPVEIYWGRQVITSLEKRYSVNTDAPGQYDLTITDVQFSDAGQYICVENGGFGPGRSTAELLVFGELKAILYSIELRRDIIM